MIELNGLEVSYEVIMQDLEEWINQGELKKYIKERYNKYAIHFGGSFAEVFIDNKEIDDYDEDRIGYEDLVYIIDRFMKDKYELDVDGEPLSWIADTASEGTLDVMKLSNFEFEESDIEISENKEILYYAFDEETEREIKEFIK